MIRVIIVDDERLNREELLLIISGRLSPEFVVVAQAENGERGAEQIIAQKPDIVVTDIKMPVCDGIKMIEKVRAHGLDTRFIITSGYAEFAYAQSALRLGVSSYLLKILNEDEVVQTLLQEAEKIKQKSEKDRQMHLNEMRQAIWDAVFLKESFNEELFNALPHKAFCVGVLHMFNSTEAPISETGEDGGAIAVTVKNTPRANEALCFICAENETRCSEKAQQIMHASAKAQNINAVFSAVFTDISLLEQWYLYCLDKQVLRFCADLPQEHSTPEKPEPSMENLQKLVRGISMGYSQNAENEIAAECSNILKACAEKTKSYSGVRMCVSGMFNILLESCKNTDILTDDKSLYLQFMSGEIICRIKSAQDFEQQIRQLMQAMLLSQEVPPGTQAIVLKIKKIVDDNCEERLALETLSEMFHIDAKYLSKQFKKFTGFNFIEYVTAARMKKAKLLLTTTGYSVQKIAFLVGYNDYPYFHRAFKTLNGITPSAYREQTMQDKA